MRSVATHRTPGWLDGAVVGVLLVLLARPRIPLILTTAEAGSESLVPGTSYYVLLVGVAALGVMRSLPRFLRSPALSAYRIPLSFMAFAMASLAWSVAPWVSARYVAQMLLIMIVAMVVSSVLSMKQIVAVVAVVSTLLIIYSLCWVLIFPEWGVIQTYVGGRWRGAFANQNALGRWSCLLFVLCGSALVQRTRMLLALIVACLAAAVILNTGSDQALGISSSIVGIIGAIELVRKSARREAVLGLLLSCLGVVCSVGLFFVTFDLEKLLGGLLSGRDGLWLALISLIPERPLLGYGAGAFWQSDAADRVRLEAQFPASQAHNTYVDVALQLGAPFAVIFTLATLVILLSSIVRYSRRAAEWPFLVFWSFGALYSMSASMILTGAFEWWFLFVIVAGKFATAVDDGLGPGTEMHISARCDLDAIRGDSSS